MKRILAFMLSVILVLTMLPVQAYAQNGEPDQTTAETIVLADEQAQDELLPTESPEVESVQLQEVLPEESQEILPEEIQEPLPVDESGTCGTDAYWSLSDSGVLSITGSGAMKDYSESSSAPWFSERLKIKSVEIGEGITYVGDYAFYYCVNVQSVSLPNTVKSIGDYGFSKCTALKSVTIPEGVNTLYSYSFYDCTSLTTVSLPSSLTSIGSYSFYKSSMREIQIPASVKTLGGGVFSHCKSLKEVTIPAGITVLNSYLFSNCISLESVTIPDSVTEIGYGAFEDCGSLKEIDIPDGVKSISSYAFENCVSLTEIILPSGLAYISSYCFDGCTGLTEMVIPKGVAKIESCAFQDCTGLKKITLPSGLVTIEDNVFHDCSSLDNVVIPDGTASIGYTCFLNCTALDTISIPATVTSLGSGAFYGCSALKEIVLPDNITVLNYETFRDCTALEQIKLPSNLQTMDYRVFANCIALEKIELPATVTNIGTYAFEGCDSLTEVVLPEGLKGISAGLFRYCDNLEKVQIPSTVTSVGEYAFGTCPKLTEITFGHMSGDALSINSNAFYLSTYTSYSDVPTTVYVPYARDIHSAVRDYQWDHYGREVAFRSFAELPMVAVFIDTHPAQVEAGLEVQFTATMEPWYTTSELTWEVDNIMGEAQIDENGVLIGITPGLVTVTCRSTDDVSVSDETQIEILEASAMVSSIHVRCEGDNEAEIELGDKVQMIADVRPGNAMNKAVTWEVENGTGTATITEDGVLTGLSCGTVTVFAMAQDGSEVIGSRMIEIMRYVTNVRVELNGREDFTQLGVAETALLKCYFSPEDANYPNGTIYVENGTGEATYRDGYLTGVSAGTVTLKVVANDSRKLTVTKEIEIVGEKAAYPAAGGSLYYNTVTGTIVGCDETVTSANIPAIIDGTKITTIGPKAFYNRDNLTSVTIPSSVTVIGWEAFRSCNNITSLRFNGSGVKIIDGYAFYDCDKLVNLTIPEGVENIGKYAFYDCDGLVNLTIPENIKSIEDSALGSLSGLKNLTIPGDYNTIGWLGYNEYLDTVTFTGSRIHEYIVHEHEDGGYSWSSMPGRNAKKVIISDTIKEIGDHGFRGQDFIEEIVIGSGVETIGKYAFYDCDGLTSISLPEGVKTLGDYAFGWCTKLAEINLPQSLEIVGYHCFAESYKLNLIDLSMNPDRMSGEELQLEYGMPKSLIVNGKNEICWDLRYNEEDREEGLPYPWDIVHVDSRSGKLYFHGNGMGIVRIECRDEYTGAIGLMEIEISSGVTIRTDRKEDYLVSGETMQLTAYLMPGNVKADVEWSLREQDAEYATINSKGRLSARAVNSAKQIEVTARPDNGGESATLKLWIVPRTTGLYIYEGAGDISGQELNVDSAVYPMMELRAVALPEGAVTDVYWESSNEKIASVDNGLVTFNGLGIVTITVYAADGSGKSASVKLNVTFRDATKKLTATVDAENNTLRAGEQTQMLVFGDDSEVPMDPAILEFGIPTSQQEIATVDEDGVITAGEKAGTATVTATMKGDPLGRRVNIKVTVVARLTEKLILHPVAEAPAQIQMLDENGNVTLDEADVASYGVLLKKADVDDGDYTFVITPEAFNSAGSFQPEKAGLKWASSNTKVATVAVQKDGTAVVTVKQGVDGACVISAVTTDKAKVENRLTVNVRDFSPRLENLKPVLNTYLSKSVELALVPSYENWITGVEIYENGVVSSRLRAAYDDGTVIISASEVIPNSNLAPVLKVTCVDGLIYEYKLTAKVKNTAPTVTVKQLDKFNLFYTDSTASVKVTTADIAVTNVELDSTDDFAVVEYDADKAEVMIRFSDSYIFDHSAKPDTKADLLVYLEGYEQPVKKTITIATATKKAEVLLTAKSSVINTAISKEHVTNFGFQLKNSTQLLDLTHAQVDVTANFADSIVQDDRVVLSLTGTKGGTATVNLQLDNWMSPLKFSHKVTVDTKKPTLKFGASALKLSSIFTDKEVSTTALLTHSNLEINSIDFVSTAKVGTDARVQADKMELRYDPNTSEVIARIADPDNAPKNGSYTFDAAVTLVDGTTLNVAKLKVTVDAAAPKVKLAASTLKLNKVLSGDEVAFTKATLDKPAGYKLVGFQLPENWDELNIPVEVDLVEGQLTVRLLDADAEIKTHTIKIYPVLIDEVTGQEVVLPTATSLKVQVYNNAKITVALSAKGKLDVVDPNSEIRYTVSKITNASGPVTGVCLEGVDADLFDAYLNEDGTVSLKTVPGVEYSLKKTYKVQFNFTVCGVDVSSAVVSFKVTQSALKFKLNPTTSTLYQSQTTPLTLRVSLTDPKSATMETITLGEKSSQEFLNALGADEMDVTIAEDGRSAIVEFDIRNAANLQFGKSYVIYLDVAAVGSATDGKLNQIKVTIKVAK